MVIMRIMVGDICHLICSRCKESPQHGYGWHLLHTETVRLLICTVGFTMPFHPFGEALMMYSKYDEAQFHLRLTHELHAKIKQRAKMNNRSINSEIVATMEESLSKPSPVSGYRDEEERLASLISERVKEVAADILRKEKTRD